jgi:hypothetical protein
MGKIQCTALKNKSDILMLERYLNNINTPFDKRIHDEYYTLKQNKTSDTESSHIAFKKRMRRFVKWYKMASPGSSLELNRNLTDKLGSLDRLYKTPVKTNSSPIGSLVISDELSKTFERNLTDIKCRRSIVGSIDLDSNAQSLSLNSNISTNKVEVNLRNACLMQRTRFCKKVTKGPPECFRFLSWMISSNLPEERNDELFNYFLKEGIEEKVDKQIKKDLNRTLSEIYDINPEDTQNSLYRLLRAFSSIDKVVAYCQGMNFIAAFLLLISEFNETDCFYMMINLFSTTFTDNFGIRGFFSEDFPLLKAYLYVFDIYFQKKFPLLHQHFKDLEIPDEVWIAKWFQTLYTICLPLNILIRFWDCLFSSGLEFLISFSLGLIQHMEKDLLKLEDAFDVIEFFKKMGPFFTTNTMSVRLNIEEVIRNAKQHGVSRRNVDELISEYEKINDTSLKGLDIKYDLNVFRYSTFKPDPDNTFDEHMRKKSSTTYNGENVIIIQSEDEIDCDEYILDDINEKLNNYKLNVKLTPIKGRPMIEDEADYI